jgi:predicted nuclease with TOPRIM domain
LKENEELNNQIQAYQEVLETRRDHEARADERYYDLKQENKRLRETLESIAKGMEINPPNSQAESVVGYFMGFAEAALKGNSV